MPFIEKKRRKIRVLGVGDRKLANSGCGLGKREELRFERPKASK